jgi:hypothetical protein
MTADLYIPIAVHGGVALIHLGMMWQSKKDTDRRSAISKTRARTTPAAFRTSKACSYRAASARGSAQHHDE